ncbi:hypothetical protein WR25_17077 [Diploscapter pachys]|uniref:Uncharacterized protein n=1 Tax=Diploscapter pachys TaxID=2018661 RepID=A0A2A2M2Q4_9BILA|nr:hypothetical protein WR25_17077 [Diploscapter pachys]
MQQRPGLGQAGLVRQLQLDMPEQLPGMGVELLRLAVLQPAPFAQGIQPTARPAVALAGRPGFPAAGCSGCPHGKRSADGAPTPIATE